MSVNTSLYAVC